MFPASIGTPLSSMSASAFFSSLSTVNRSCRSGTRSAARRITSSGVNSSKTLSGTFIRCAIPFKKRCDGLYSSPSTDNALNRPFSSTTESATFCGVIRTVSKRSLNGIGRPGSAFAGSTAAAPSRSSRISRTTAPQSPSRILDNIKSFTLNSPYPKDKQ